MAAGIDLRSQPTAGPVADAPNCAHAFAAALFEELARAGVRHVCVSPGSRSTPLAVAAAGRPELRLWSHVDERSAGFFALGLARASRAPVALVCTSGTAAANFLPAVIEAHHGRVPLVVLTADRPPELRDWGAGQTIEQHGLYGRCVRWFAEAPTPEPSSALLRYARALAARAVDAARGAAPGPVHLNLPFREPLEPAPVAGDTTAEVARGDRLAAFGRAAPGAVGPGYTEMLRAPRTPPPDLVADLVELVRAHPRGAIACGPMDAPRDLVDAIAELGRVSGWPILADPASQMRCGPHVGEAPIVAMADLLLRDPRFAAAHAPEVVLRFGASPTSKSLRLWLERHAPSRVVTVDPDGAGWSDPSHLASRVLYADPVELCTRVARLACAPATAIDPTRARAEWGDAFRRADRAAREAVDVRLARGGELFEPRAVRELAAALPEDAVLYVSNSMPIRDLDAFLPARTAPLRVLCNRGASGIDGMVSSALGAAAADRGRVVLLTGDLAFLHDVGGLLAAHRHGLSATIVVFDNDGGGIFSFLPIAAYGERVRFTELFRTPHGLALGPVARAFGLEHERVASPDGLRRALAESLASDRSRVVEVPIDPAKSLAQHREIDRAVGARLAREPFAGAREPLGMEVGS